MITNVAQNSVLFTVCRPILAFAEQVLRYGPWSASAIASRSGSADLVGSSCIVGLLGACSDSAGQSGHAVGRGRVFMPLRGV
jgi:hypothetical protein